MLLNDRRAALVLVPLVTCLAPTARSAPAGPAAEPDQRSRTPPLHTPWEWVGLELTPVGYGVGDVTFKDGYSRLLLGPGGTLRLLRRQWTDAYFTPLLLGLFVPKRGDGGFGHAQVEGGAIFPLGNGHRVELGLGLGVGVLIIEYGNGNDGSRTMGGVGLLVSPVARYRVDLGPDQVIGVGIRLAVPIPISQGSETPDHGALLLAGLDLGLGS